jgi:hypothetical protein
MNFTARYALDPIAAKFHNDFEHHTKLLTGAVGTGKTFTCLMECVMFCMRVIPPTQREFTGSRKGRVLVFRKSYPRLETTVIESVKKLFGPTISLRYGYPIEALQVGIPDVYHPGETIDIEWLFYAMADETSKDEIDKLRSLEVTCAYGNEISEYGSSDIIPLVFGRCGRYPEAVKEPNAEGVLVPVMRNGKPVGYCGERQVIGDYNKGFNDTWVAEWHTKPSTRPKSVAIHDYPPPIIEVVDADGEVLRYEPNPEAEAYASKQPGGFSYWVDQLEMNKHNRPYIETLLLNRYISRSSGRRVFSRYEDSRNLIPEKSVPEINPAKTIFIGFDHSGLNPAMSIMQIGTHGIYILAELYAFDAAPDEFIHSVFIPYVVERDWPREGLDIICDPADPRGRSIGAHMTMVKALHTLGFTRAHPAGPWGRDPERMIRLVNESFVRGLLHVSPRCEFTLTAIRSGYRYRELRSNVVAESLRPVKDQYSHIADAIGLAVGHIRLGFTGAGNAASGPIGVSEGIV